MSLVLEDETSLDDIRQALKAKEAQCDHLLGALRSAVLQRDELAQRIQTHPSQRRIMQVSDDIDIFSSLAHSELNFVAFFFFTCHAAHTPQARDGAETAATVPQRRTRSADATKRKLTPQLPEKHDSQYDDEYESRHHGKKCSMRKTWSKKAARPIAQARSTNHTSQVPKYTPLPSACLVSVSVPVTHRARVAHRHGSCNTAATPAAGY